MMRRGMVRRSEMRVCVQSPAELAPLRVQLLSTQGSYLGHMLILPHTVNRNIVVIGLK